MRLFNILAVFLCLFTSVGIFVTAASAAMLRAGAAKADITLPENLSDIYMRIPATRDPVVRRIQHACNRAALRHLSSTHLRS